MSERKFWVRCPNCDDQDHVTVIDIKTRLDCICGCIPEVMHDDECEKSLGIYDEEACTCDIDKQIIASFIEQVTSLKLRQKPLSGIDDPEKFMETIKSRLWELGAMLYQRQFDFKDDKIKDMLKDFEGDVKHIESFFPAPDKAECQHVYSEKKDNTFIGYEECLKCDKPIDTAKIAGFQKEIDGG